MKSIKLARALREGVKNFYRDKWLTFATIIIMTLALYLVGVAIFLGFGVFHTVQIVENRINISMYFDFTVSEDKIMQIKKEIEDRSIRQIQSIEYISQQKALDDFLTRTQESSEMKDVIEMLDGNPLPASLVIVAKKTDEYVKIDQFLHQEYGEYIMSTNYEKNKEMIDNIYRFVVFSRNIGIILSIIFIIIAILVTLNTIRMSLYAHRKEFEIMRLVGASNLYVKLPTIVEGVLYGFVSGICASIFLFGTLYMINPFAKKVIHNIDLLHLYRHDIVLIMTCIVIFGVFFGFVSSSIGVRRYLEK